MEEEGIEAAGEGVGAVEGRDDDGDRGSLIVFRWSVQDSSSLVYAVG